MKLVATKAEERPLIEHNARQNANARGSAFVIPSLAQRRDGTSFTTVFRQKFDGLGITPVEGTAQEFLQLIAAPENLPAREQIIAQLHPGLLETLSAAGVTSHAQQVHLQQFLSAFQLIRQPERMPRVGKEFLLGAGPDWSDIYAEVDAHRDCEDALLLLVQHLSLQSSVGILVAGSAGSGTSTVMMRVALRLANQGTQVLFSNSFYSVAAHHIAPSLATFAEPLVIFVDDGATALPTLSALTEAVRLSGRRTHLPR